ncbi:unnamed protein product, partial [Iphiclides podalirius]
MTGSLDAANADVVTRMAFILVACRSFTEPDSGAVLCHFAPKQSRRFGRSGPRQLYARHIIHSWRSVQKRFGVGRARHSPTSDNRRKGGVRAGGVGRDARLCARALFWSRWHTRRLIGTSRDERRKDAGRGRGPRGAGGAASECSHHRSMHGPPIDRPACPRRRYLAFYYSTAFVFVLAPHARGLQAITHPRAPHPATPLSNAVSKQSGVYPRLARTERVASRLRGALAVPIIFVTGIAPKPIPASSPQRRREVRSRGGGGGGDGRSHIARHSTPEAHCRIGARLMKRPRFRRRPAADV